MRAKKAQAKKPKPKAKKLLKPDKYGDTALWTAAADNDLPKLRELLEGGTEPNVGDSDRLTPLSIAASRGHAEAIELLLQHGADPNLVDCNGTSPLHKAAAETGLVRGTEGHGRAVELLLTAGADPDHKNKWGASARSIVKVMGSPAAKKLFAKVRRRPAKTSGPGRRAPTYAELTGTVDENYYWTRHERLWDELVPPSGQAKTLQGEIIRITGKLTREAYTNGNINWGPDCTRLWKLVAETIDDPELFTEAERAEVHEWVKEIIRDRSRPDTSGEGSPYYRVTERAVIWVEAHPKPIRHKVDPTIHR
jgi:hypothetical protein